MEKVKIKSIKTGAITEVKKALADDYIGTGDFVIYKEEFYKSKEEIKPKNSGFRKEE